MASTQLINWEVIYPKRTKDLFGSQRIKALVLNSMMRDARAMEKDLKSTVQHWDHKPTFISTIRYAGGEPRIYVGLVGTNKANDLWNKVNYGTRRRYVTFNPKYMTKTQYPGSFHSNRPGKFTKGRGLGGKIVGISKKALPGIRPRNWLFLLRDTYKQPFKDHIDDAIRKGLSK